MPVMKQMKQRFSYSYKHPLESGRSTMLKGRDAATRVSDETTCCRPPIHRSSSFQAPTEAAFDPSAQAPSPS